MSSYQNALGLDLGAARIGVARINAIARIAEPLVVLANDAHFDDRLEQLLAEHAIDLIVVGLPRNLSGETTQQSDSVIAFCKQHLDHLSIPYVYQDETLSTHTAKTMLSKKHGVGMEDALAACVILEDFATL
jgi:putative Holliday junction resolvase